MADDQKPDQPPRDYEHEMRTWTVVYTNRVLAFAAHLGAIAQMSATVVNGLILVNISSAGATLLLLGTLWGKSAALPVFDPAVRAVSMFAIGAMCGLLCGAFAYVCQFFYSRADANQDYRCWRLAFTILAVPSHIVAVIAAIGGGIAFGLGAYDGIEALKLARWQ